MASAGWSFLKVLENPSLDSKNLDEVYVHPMVKRSTSALSSKSLEMCTESLGSETGSDASESGDVFYAISMEERERLRAIQRSKCRNFDRKVRRNDFPPPLTSISGSDGALKVNQHREGGRLVIKAVSFFNCGTHFKTERTNGRLRLSLLRDRFVNYESGRVEMENYEKGGEVESDDEEEDVVAVAVAAEEDEGGWRRDMDGNQWRLSTETPNHSVEAHSGKGELKVLTRCKEGGNGNKVFTNNWGSCRVAIS